MASYLLMRKTVVENVRWNASTHILKYAYMHFIHHANRDHIWKIIFHKKCKKNFNGSVGEKRSTDLSDSDGNFTWLQFQLHGTGQNLKN